MGVDEVVVKILLVEDNIATTEAVALCLELYKPEAVLITTTTGAEALKRLHSESFDCVLVDLGLPDMDGLEVLAEIRNCSTARPVVVSARRGEDVIARAKELGAAQYVTKPFSHQSLIGCLSAVFPAN